MAISITPDAGERAKIEAMRSALVLVAAALVLKPMSALASDPALISTIQQFQADEGALSRLFPVNGSPARSARLKKLYQDYEATLKTVKFDKLDLDGKADFVLMGNHLGRELRTLELEAKRQAEYAVLVPFAEDIFDLEESRRRFEAVEPEKAAATLNGLVKKVADARKAAEAGIKVTPNVANRGSEAVRELRRHMDTWFDYFNGYDPLFSWWCDAPYKALDEALKAYADFLRERLAGVKPGDNNAIVGAPVGRESLVADLQYEMIPYTPEELIALGDREYAWCEAEMKKASGELGYGDDWKKALEHVKNLHVKPGGQPELIRELAVEAIAFLKKHDLVTIPALAEESWRMEMMSPERQLVSPFFLGGETIIVSYPTNTMSHDAKLMSMRGNNRHFSRATVQHELIPGHHLQQFMNQRNKPYRRVFSTPFWIEGWALYWEMLLWDLGFAKAPEDRIGMLFWRMHRCARITFSLRFHLGEMTPEQCIKFLVDKVGHEPSTAEGEVRRSFSGDYPPLYQLAYMIGGLQFRAMHKELVQSGRITNKAFHDAILREHNIPVEVLRSLLTQKPLGADFRSGWRFAD